VIVPYSGRTLKRLGIKDRLTACLRDAPVNSGDAEVQLMGATTVGMRTGVGLRSLMASFLVCQKLTLHDVASAIPHGRRIKLESIADALLSAIAPSIIEAILVGAL
jgi:hypothetical protein